VSETDSEVIALLIGLYLDEEGTEIVDAIKKACLKLVGSYNLAIIYLKDPSAVYAIKNTGELCIGQN